MRWQLKLVQTALNHENSGLPCWASTRAVTRIVSWMESCSHCSHQGEQGEDTNKLQMKDFSWVALFGASPFWESQSNCQMEPKECADKHKSIRLQNKNLFQTISKKITTSNGKDLIILTMKHLICTKSPAVGVTLAHAFSMFRGMVRMEMTERWLQCFLNPLLTLYVYNFNKTHHFFYIHINIICKRM